jgi:hypothetical protein
LAHRLTDGSNITNQPAIDGAADVAKLLSPRQDSRLGSEAMKDTPSAGVKHRNITLRITTIMESLFDCSVISITCFV